MLKAQLRKKYKDLRSQLSQSEIDNLSISIANNLIELPVWTYSFYHIFLSIESQKEVNTEPLLSILSGMDKNIVIPKSNFDNGTMTNYLLTDSTRIKKNKYNIPEPVDGIEINNSKIDVVFIPLLTFDNKGNRVGYGKGFYDVFLSNCPENTIKIGLSFFDPEPLITDVNPHDIPLDYCITPKATLSFK